MKRVNTFYDKKRNSQDFPIGKKERLQPNKHFQPMASKNLMRHKNGNFLHSLLIKS